MRLYLTLLIFLAAMNNLSAGNFSIDYSKLETQRDYYSDIRYNALQLTEKVETTKNILTFSADEKFDLQNSYSLYNVNRNLATNDLRMGAFDFGFGMRLWNFELLYAMTGIMWGSLDKIEAVPGSFFYPFFHPAGTSSYDDPVNYVPPGGVDNVFNLSETYSFFGYNDETFTLGIGAYVVKPPASIYDPYTSASDMNRIEYKIVVLKVGASVVNNFASNSIENLTFFWEPKIAEYPELKIKPSYRYVNANNGSIVGFDTLSWSISKNLDVGMPIYWKLSKLLPDSFSPNIQYKIFEFVALYANSFIYPVYDAHLGIESGFRLSLNLPWSSEILLIDTSYSYNNKYISGNFGNISPSILRILARLSIPNDIFPKKAP